MDTDALDSFGYETEEYPEYEQEITVEDPLATEDIEGELAVDVYQTDRAIIVKCMTAGVRKADLDISITRESLTIHGRRDEDYIINEDQYYHRELYWGAFSRTIVLPEEIEVEEAEATEEHGLLTITLPLLDKHKEAKLKVK